LLAVPYREVINAQPRITLSEKNLPTVVLMSTKSDSVNNRLNSAGSINLAVFEHGVTIGIALFLATDVYIFK
jgi:hypothetical protein